MKVKGGNRLGTVLGYGVLRILLGVDMGLIIELVGGYVLTQADFSRYDFKSHKKGDAIVFIGCVGGLAIGLMLIIVDYTIGNYWRFRDGPDIRRESNWSELHKRPIPHVASVRNQAALRIIIWPAMGAVGSIVGTLLWHLHKNDKPGNHPGDRTITAAIVGAVGAAIVVSAPSMLQLLVVGGGGDKEDT